MKTSLRDIVLAVRYGEAALVGESAGYLVLGAADLALQLPRLAHLDSVHVCEDGSVEVDGGVGRHDEVEQSLRRLLGRLLAEVRTPCPNLLRVAQRHENRGMADFVTELEAALVPVNRRAARRSLARLVREAVRAASRLQQHIEVEDVPVEQFAPTTEDDDPTEPTTIMAEVEDEAAAPVAPAAFEVAVPHAPQATDPLDDAETRIAAPVEQVVPSDPLDEAETRMAAPVEQVVPSDPLDEAETRMAAPVEQIVPSDPLDEAEARMAVSVDPENHELPAEPEIPAVPEAIAPSIPSPVPPRSSARKRGGWKVASESLDPDVPLIASKDEPAKERRPSDVGELLDRMRVTQAPSSELFDGLKKISRVEHSPQPPPVES